MEAVRGLSRSAVVVFVAVCALAGFARAAVVDSVPADALGIIKIQDPVAQYDKVRDSALLKKLEDPSFIPEAAAKIAEMRAGVQSFESQMGVDVHQVMADVLGREAAVVVLPGNLGALVVEGRDAASLQKGVDEFVRVQRAVGDFTAESTSSYKDLTIRSGMQKKGTEEYYVVSGNVLVVSSQLEAVQKVVDVIKGGPALGASAQYRSASAMMAKGAPITGYLSGKALQPLMDKLQAQKGGSALEQMLRARVAAVVPAVDYAVLSASGDGAPQAQVTIAYKNNRIPDVIQSGLPERGSRMDVLKLAPKTAALVAARSINFQLAWDSLVKMADPARAERMERGLDFVVGTVGGVESREQFFSELGNQVALFVLPSVQQGDLPAAVLALHLRQTDHIPNALETIIGLGVGTAQQQGRDISIEHSEYKNAQFTTVRSGGPGPLAKLSPTLGVVDSYMVVTSTLDAAKSVVDAARSSSSPAASKPGTPFFVLSVSAPQVRAMLTQYRGFLLNQAVTRDGKPREQAQREMEALDKVLSLLQSVQITNTFDPGRTNHYVTIELAGSRP